MNEPLFIIVDLFCGFGGTTKGFEDAMYVDANGKLQKVAKVIACINHDPKAIKSHWLNHPDVKHFEEDIRTLDLTELVKTVAYWRNLYPNAKLILWASLECTNFSKAKGGQPRNADSRTLAESLYRIWDASNKNEDGSFGCYVDGLSYIQLLNPDYIKIENVVEFMSWGPLDENGKPISKRNGEYWIQWKKELCKFGYRDEWKKLNSANFGAYTSRNRLFGCFAKPELPIVWPEATHSKKGTNGMFGHMKKWKAVKDVLNFADKGESIFNDLVPVKAKAALKYLKTKGKTESGIEKRIVIFPSSLQNPVYGLEPKGIILRSQANEFNSIINAYCEENKIEVTDLSFYRYDPYSENTNERVYAGLVKFVANGDTSFVSNYKSGHPASKNTSIDTVSGTLTTIPTQALVQGEFLMASNGGTPSAKVFSTDDPCRVITTSDNKSLVQPEFLLKYNSLNGKTGVHIPPSIEDPCPTLTCQARLGIVQPTFLQHYYSPGYNTSIDEPNPTIKTKDSTAVVQPEFLSHYYGNGFNTSPDVPCPTITTKERVGLVQPIYFMLNPQFSNNGASVEKPCFTLIAKMDKRPPSLVQAETGEMMIQVYASDSPMIVKIKQLMAAFGLVDIKMRMLRVVELLLIQGFPADYQMVGNQADHKKFIGNSVTPIIPKSWSEAYVPKLIQLLTLKAA